MKSKEEIQLQIIAAAEDRFCHYGFGKTTMAEIAKDCQMSAANIYRFFESKKEILIGIALSNFIDTEKKLREILKKPDYTAAARLELFVITMLHCTHDLYANKPKINESCDVICQENFDLVFRHKEKKTAYIAEILAEGNRTNEFEVEDVLSTANTIIKGTALVQVPLFMTLYTYEQLEHDAKAIINLFICGIVKK